MRWVAIGRPTWGIVTLPCVVAVLAGPVIVGCGSGSVRLTSERTPVAVPGSPVPASAIPRLRAIADRAAKENGGAVPSWISAVVTSQEKALTSATPGAVVPAGGKTVVYLVTMKGHFTFERGPRAVKPEMGSRARGRRTRAPGLQPDPARGHGFQAAGPFGEPLSVPAGQCQGATLAPESLRRRMRYSRTVAEDDQCTHARSPYPAVGIRAGYPPASMSSMRVGPAGTQPRSSRVTVLVAARSMPKKVPIHPK